MVGNVGARVGKGMPRHKDVATAQEPRWLLARRKTAPTEAGAGGAYLAPSPCHG